MGKRVVLVLTLAIIAATTMAMAGAAFAVPGKTDPGAGKGLAQVRQATAKYHDVDAALADGYVDPGPGGCVEVPGLGGMGHHFVNPDLAGDLAVDPLKPEVLLYAPKNDGGLRLVAVEYFVADVGQPTPAVFGEPLEGPMAGHEPGMPIHYDLHAWIWKGNPDGLFADFNPKVSC